VSYLVLARKYRPQTFEDLVGQDHVARTLANAIATGRVAHAFLFTGVRGVGKTTSARLLAKCLNCVGPDGKRTGPTATPCNECAPCREITAGQDLDVQEIDGASYNGVDEVRRLQEGMSFRPARDRFKTYIVDEVHMLSTNAWNAFLKTLEEPPPHVKFIFATTEVHKVPVTILSRCQRYDFKLIPTQVIARRLETVLAQERIEADAVAVQVLARQAAGSMRDAMSLLDQVIAFSGEKLSGDDVAQVLGVASNKVLHDLAAALVVGDAAKCLDMVDGVSQQGFDLAQLSKDLLGHLRNLVVAKVCTADGAEALRELLDLADEESREVFDLAARTDVDDLTRLFHGFSRAFDEILKSGQPRMALEMTLVRMARRPPLLPLDELLARVGELEKRLGGAPSPGGPGPRGGGGTRGTHAVPSAASSAPPARSASHPVDPGPSRTHGALALADPPPRASPGAAPAAARTPLAAVVDLPVAAPAPPPAAAAAAPPLPVAPAPPAAAVPAPGSARGVDLDVWRAVLDRVRAVRPDRASIFEHAVVAELGPARVAIGFEPSQAFLAARASDPEALETLTAAARAHFGTATHVEIDTAAKPGSGSRTVASLDAAQREADLRSARSAIESHPLVKEVIRLFDARIRDVKLPSTDG
jgi:DNA polymerase-3 subunit gamma/tau